MTTEKDDFEAVLDSLKKDRVIAELKKELNKSGSGRGKWHVAHSCVPKQQYWTLEEERDKLREFARRAISILRPQLNYRSGLYTVERVAEILSDPIVKELEKGAEG